MNPKILCIIIFISFANIVFAQNPRIAFTENKNQWNTQVQYRTPLYGGYMYAEKQGLTYYFIHPDSQSHSHAQPHNFDDFDEHEIQKQLDEFTKTGRHAISKDTCHAHEHSLPEFHKTHTYRVSFKGMRTKHCRIQAYNELPGIENYFKGNNPATWAQGVKTYGNIIYHNLYKHIDLHLYDSWGALKYDLIIHPGGNPKNIELVYSHIDSMKLDPQGNLVLFTSVNQVYEQKPYAFQIIHNDTIEIPCAYILEGNTIKYQVDSYNKKYTLYIDPELIFSTYTGSTADNWGFTATYDSENNVYAGGIVDAFGYPVNMGAYQTTYGGGSWDIGIIKYDPSGTQRLYATYLGGISAEMPHSLIVNSNNDLLILGTTSSPDFPMANAYNSTFMGGKPIVYNSTQNFENGIDMFIAKLSADGTQLLSSTFFGGTGNDGINFDWETNILYGHDSLYYNYGDGARGEIMVDANDNIYVASTTFSNDFPVVNAFQPTSGGSQDGVVFKFDPTLTTLLWSSYMGGSSKDALYSVDVDKNGNVYATGGTCSPSLNFTVNGFIASRIGGTVDAIVLKIDQETGSLLGSTYFGSTAYDQAHFVRVNNIGNIFIFGQTRASGSSLVYNAPYNNPNSGQFLASFSNDLSSLNWSTVFGSGIGRPNISPTAFEVDICNRIYLAGSGRDWTNGQATGWYYDSYYGYLRYDMMGWNTIQGTKNMDITSDAFQSYTDGKDFYILVIDDEAKNLDYATYFGEINYGGWVSYDGLTQQFIPCAYSGNDHVDGGTSRFDSKGYIYQSVCASCGGCNGFPKKPNPGAWSVSNNSVNCNNAVMRFFIDFGLLIADFEIPELTCQSKELQFTNTTKIYYNNPQITYTWDFGDGSPKSHDFEPSHIYAAPGEYWVKLVVQDSSACNLADSIMKKLVIVNDINYQSLPNIHICLGEQTEIGIPNMYDPSLTYKWEPTIGLENDTLPKTIAKPDTTTNYTLTVSSPGWCQTIFSQTVHVYQDDYEISLITASKNPVCFGETIRITATTNAPTKRYFFSTTPNFSSIINSDFTQNYIDITPTQTTTYYVHTQSTHCEFEAIAAITIQVSFHDIFAYGDTLICKGDFVNIYAQNNIPSNSVSYLWTPQYAIAIDGNTASPLVNPEKTTQFIVYATNQDGCVIADTVVVEVDELIIDTQLDNPISCYGQTDAAIVISPIGISPYTYLWDDGSTLPSRYNLAKGTYTITVTDGLGCENSREFVIIEPDSLQIANTTFAPVQCLGACNGYIYADVQGGTLPYTYQWSQGDTTAFISNKCSGYYSLKVTDAHGCLAALDKPIHIGNLNTYPKLDAYADAYHLYKGQTIQIHASKSAIDTLEYLWFPNIWMEHYTKHSANATPENSITYYVRATDQYGCSTTDTVQLTVHNWVCGDPFVFIPTAFSPNNDGINDLVEIQGKGIITDVHLLIYDRWGEKIFETTDISQTWDGTYLNKPLAPQVFVFYFEATCINNERYVQKGNITLIR